MRRASLPALFTAAILISGCSSGPSDGGKMARIAVWEDEGWTANGQLYAYLFDASEEVRERAALALGRVNDTLALDTLRHALLNDRSPRVRAMAAFAVGAWQWRLGGPALLEAVKGENDPEVLVTILQSLARNYVREEYRAYVHLLRHADPRVRAQAALTLDMVNQREAADSIITLLNDPEPMVVKVAMISLLRMHQEKAARWALDKCHDPDPEMRELAYRLVGSFALPESAETLLQGLEDPDPIVRAGVADGYMALRDTLAVMEMLPYMEREADARVLQLQIRALAQLWREIASQDLQAYLSHPDPAVRAEATAALCNRRDWLCSDLIAPAAVDPSPRVRLAFLAAVDKVQRFGGVDTSIILPLLRRLAVDSIPRVRARAVQSYTVYGLPDGWQMLDNLLHESDPEAVSKAVSLIGTYRIGHYTDSLHALYQKYRDDPLPEVKWALLASGANMLPSIHIDSVRQDLLDWAMADPNRLVRWYCIAVANKFRKDLRAGLGIYQTDLTPENVESLLHPYPAPPQLRLNTTKGPVTIALDTRWAPRTARRMITLARAGVYDNMPINDAQVGRVIQTGDRRGDGYGLPPGAVRDEYSPLRVEKGAVFWIVQTRDSGRGIFAIALTRQPYLDWRYSVFGKVVDGLDNAAALTVRDTIRTVDVIIPDA